MKNKSIIPDVDYSLNIMDNPHNDIINNNNFRRGWYAGAEAMLAKLRESENALEVTPSKVTGVISKMSQFVHPNKPGKIVFIPDDSSDDGKK